ncbi:hypothetical protein ABT065_37260 [Streptomyces sp. NPDC002764]
MKEQSGRTEQRGTKVTLWRKVVVTAVARLITTAVIILLHHEL